MPKLTASELWTTALKGAVSGGFDYVHYSDQGQPLWAMSGNASEFNSKGLILIANPSFEFYLSEGNIHFEAGSARVDSDSKCFVFSSNVLCLQPGLSAVRAQQACYHAGEDVIEVSKGFSIKNPDMVLSGDSAMIDRGDGRVDVEGVVEVEIWRE